MHNGAVTTSAAREIVMSINRFILVMCNRELFIEADINQSSFT
jgi:hypothetical protein